MMAPVVDNGPEILLILRRDNRLEVREIQRGTQSLKSSVQINFLDRNDSHELKVHDFFIINHDEVVFNCEH
jgi:hypothetical protein